jgi:hypothetical protein
MTHLLLKPEYQRLGERWKSAWVSRQEIGSFTGGVVSEKYMANLDSRGLGPKGRIRVGRKIAYPVTELVAWLEGRSEAVN